MTRKSQYNPFAQTRIRLRPPQQRRYCSVRAFTLPCTAVAAHHGRLEATRAGATSETVGVELVWHGSEDVKDGLPDVEHCYAIHCKVEI